MSTRQTWRPEEYADLSRVPLRSRSPQRATSEAARNTEILISRNLKKMRRASALKRHDDVDVLAMKVANLRRRLAGEAPAVRRRRALTGVSLQ